MSMTGLEDIKAKVLGIMAKMETVRRQGSDMKKERLGVVMLGNSGTGKTTIGRLYAQFLTSMGALSGCGFVESSGSSLANEGIKGTTQKIDALLKSGGGVFFLDEAYQLTSESSYGGGAVLDFLLTEIEDRVGSIVFVFAGYTKEMEAFFEHNPGLDSRLPHRWIFADYTNPELLLMLERFVRHKYSGRAQLEEGARGLYATILIDRLGRGRGTPGFGNARSVQNLWAKVADRQALRLSTERRDGLKPDDLMFSKEDLIGPPPRNAIESSSAWREVRYLSSDHTVGGQWHSLWRRSCGEVGLAMQWTAFSKHSLSLGTRIVHLLSCLGWCVQAKARSWE